MNVLLSEICFDQLLSYLKRFSCLVLSPKLYKVELEVLCAKVAKAQPRLPDGRRLLFRVQGIAFPLLDAQEKAVA